MGDEYSQAAVDRVLAKGGMPLAKVRQPARHLLFFEASRKSSPRNSGSWSLSASVMVKSGIYAGATSTVGHRHGTVANPAFYGVFVDGHVERLLVNDVAADLQLRKDLFAGGGKNGKSIY